MADLIKAILFGIVEGVTEWLPVSSTGHMILLNEFVRMEVSEEFFEMFLVVIQLGAILAVVLLFWNTFFPLAIEPAKKRGVSSIEKDARRIVWRKDVLILWGKILVACVPAAVIGVLFDDVFDALFYNGVSVAIALIVFGVGFLVVEKMNAGKKAKIRTLQEIDLKTALLIGVFQLIAAIFPGTSRSGATILGALLIGVARGAAAEFTFLLAIPVMAGASLLKLLKFGFSFTPAQALLLATGMVVAFIVSVFVIRFLLQYIRRHDFRVFGWYRIALGLIVLLYFMFVK